jgi:hypothetical protein
MVLRSLKLEWVTKLRLASIEVMTLKKGTTLRDLLLYRQRA